MAKSLGSPLLLAAVWCAMAGMMVCGALCYAELAVRFPEALLPPESRARLDAFVDEGRHGDMAWMETRRAERAQPRRLTWAPPI